MISEHEVIRHFVDYTLQQTTTREIPLWYVGYYSEISDPTFRKYMKGIRLPAPVKLIMIAELFECTVNELLGFEPVDVRPRDHLFDSGRDTRVVHRYFADQIMKYSEGIALPDSMTNALKEYIRYCKLPDTTTLLTICDSLMCTPSELLGY